MRVEVRNSTPWHGRPHRLRVNLRQEPTRTHQAPARVSDAVALFATVRPAHPTPAWPTSRPPGTAVSAGGSEAPTASLQALAELALTVASALSAAAATAGVALFKLVQIEKKLDGQESKIDDLGATLTDIRIELARLQGPLYPQVAARRRVGRANDPVGSRQTYASDEGDADRDG